MRGVRSAEGEVGRFVGRGRRRTRKRRMKGERIIRGTEALGMEAEDDERCILGFPSPTDSTSMSTGFLPSSAIPLSTYVSSAVPVPLRLSRGVRPGASPLYDGIRVEDDRMGMWEGDFERSLELWGVVIQWKEDRLRECECREDRVAGGWMSSSL